jgi:N-acetylglucosamine-6-phosphate deacetylase
MNYVIRRARIVGRREVSEGDLLIENGRIAATGKVGRAPGAKVIPGAGLYALPGFMDIHVHGGNGFDLTCGRFDVKEKRFDASPSAYAEGFPRLMKRFARNGVTRVMLATVAAPMKELEQALSRMADYVADPLNGRHGARLEGALIEGTFIRKPERAGAQNPKNFRAPDRRLFERLNRAARGHIAYVNVVPEYGKAEQDLTRHLTELGVLVGAGHTECDADQVLRSARNGNRVAIHFLNGSIGTSFKPFHGGNVVEAVLRSREIYAELICDGWHIAPAYVRDVIERKGISRIILVTDAMFPAGARGIRSFAFAGREGQLDPTGQYLRLKGSEQTLFGSVLTLSRAFSNLLSWLTQEMDGVWHARHRAWKLDEALMAAARACATNPAHVTGMDRPAGSAPRARDVGTIEPGRCADLILAGLKGKPGHWRIQVKHAFVEGRPVL